MNLSNMKSSTEDVNLAERGRAISVYLFMKRVLDLLGASLGILMLSPVFLIVALLIKLDDPTGPVFFKQKRVGFEGKHFVMYKFRSMKADAEDQLSKLLDQNEIQGAMFKMKADPRITRIGKFIRKTSLDEFPQLLNVLKGEMSLVGPRPPLPSEVEQYTSNDKRRLSVTPGCTGYWQVNGRSNVNFKEMVEMDLFYIDNRSSKLDFIILLKTFKEVIASKGSY